MQIKTSLLIVLIFLVTKAYSQVNLNNGLVGFFPLNGNTNDLSALNINGTANNVISSTGINNLVNTAYDFNGINSNINAGTSDRGILDTVVVSAWIKTTDTNYTHVVSKYDWGADRGFHLVVSSGRARIAGKYNSGSYTATPKSNKVISDGHWHHLLAKIYANTWEIWVDCELDQTASSNSSNPNLVCSQPLTIGNWNYNSSGNPSQFFNGSIDEVRIYNRLLTQDEIDILCKINTGTDVKNQNLKSNIQLFPNPASDIISIQGETNKVNKVEIYSITGSKIISLVNSKDYFDISGLTSGVYMIKFIDANGFLLKTQKFIKD